MNDQLPEITEEFTVTVLRSDGGKETANYVAGQKPSGQIIGMSIDIESLAKEVLNGRRQDKA